jgi:2-hydroxy-4-(methylsulfanyl)butanoate S-methyltransferase
MAEPLDNVRDISRIAYGFLARAFAALTPGGRIVLHDFMVDDDGRGPATAALWLVNALLIDPDVARLSPSLLAERLRAQGFDQLEHAEVIPGITRTITAVKRPG